MKSRTMSTASDSSGDFEGEDTDPSLTVCKGSGDEDARSAGNDRSEGRGQFSPQSNTQQLNMNMVLISQMYVL